MGVAAGLARLVAAASQPVGDWTASPTRGPVWPSATSRTIACWAHQSASTVLGLGVLSQPSRAMTKSAYERLAVGHWLARHGYV